MAKVEDIQGLYREKITTEDFEQLGMRDAIDMALAQLRNEIIKEYAVHGTQMTVSFVCVARPLKFGDDL